MQEPKAGRRIVSRGEYVRARLIGALLFMSFLACAVGVMFLMIAIRFTWGFENANDSVADYNYGFTYFWGSIILFLPLAVTTHLLGRKTRSTWKAVRTMQPIDYANTADLPAPDSLVRASQEPAQAQEAVLLRAASGEAQAGQEGQLLRASVGGQE